MYGRAECALLYPCTELIWEGRAGAATSRCARELVTALADGFGETAPPSRLKVLSLPFWTFIYEYKDRLFMLGCMLLCYVFCWFVDFVLFCFVFFMRLYLGVP